jgi:hypothetical protein
MPAILGRRYDKPDAPGVAAVAKGTLGTLRRREGHPRDGGGAGAGGGGLVGWLASERRGFSTGAVYDSSGRAMY